MVNYKRNKGYLKFIKGRSGIVGDNRINVKHMNEAIKIIGALTHDKTLKKASVIQQKIKNIERLIECISAPTETDRIKCLVNLIIDDIETIRNHSSTQKKANTMNPLLDELIDHLNKLYEK
jgi:glutamate mutase epsilon subunit